MRQRNFQNDPVDYKAFQVARIVRSTGGYASLTELAHLICHEIRLLADGLLCDFALLRKGDKDLLSGWLRYGLHVRSDIGCEIQIEWQEHIKKTDSKRTGATRVDIRQNESKNLEVPSDLLERACAIWPITRVYIVLDGFFGCIKGIHGCPNHNGVV